MVRGDELVQLPGGDQALLVEDLGGLLGDLAQARWSGNGGMASRGSGSVDERGGAAGAGGTRPAAGVVGKHAIVQILEVGKDLAYGSAPQVAVDRRVEVGHADGIVVVCEQLLDRQIADPEGLVGVPLRLIDIT